MPPRRDFRVLRGTRVLAQCGRSGLLGVLDHGQHIGCVGVSSRLHGTYGYLACLGVKQRSTATLNACSTRRGKTSVGDAASWRGIDGGSLFLRTRTYPKSSFPKIIF